MLKSDIVIYNFFCSKTIFICIFLYLDACMKSEREIVKNRGRERDW